jgi:hypothetical protein
VSSRVTARPGPTRTCGEPSPTDLAHHSLPTGRLAQTRNQQNATKSQPTSSQRTRSLAAQTSTTSPVKPKPWTRRNCKLPVSLWQLLAHLLVATVAAVSPNHRPSATTWQGAVWSSEPRLGEAGNPGPLSIGHSSSSSSSRTAAARGPCPLARRLFDADETSEWSEVDEHDLDPSYGLDEQKLEFEAWRQEQQLHNHDQTDHVHAPLTSSETTTAQPCNSAEDVRPEAVPKPTQAQEWLKEHAGKHFVPAAPLKNPKSKESRFEGERPGWVFKLGDRGLGYYSDKQLPSAVSLAGEIWPSGGRLAVTIPLFE